MALNDNPYNIKLYTFITSVIDATKAGAMKWEQIGNRSYRVVANDTSIVISGNDSVIPAAGDAISFKFYNKRDIEYEYHVGLIHTQLDNNLEELLNLIETTCSENLGKKLDTFIQFFSAKKEDTKK